MARRSAFGGEPPLASLGSRRRAQLKCKSCAAMLSKSPNYVKESPNGWFGGISRGTSGSERNRLVLNFAIWIAVVFGARGEACPFFGRRGNKWEQECSGTYSNEPKGFSVCKTAVGAEKFLDPQ